MKAIPTYPKGTAEELMSFYPSFYRDIKEMRAVQDAAAKQLDILFEAIQKAADDSNITTAAEDIIAFYERVIGLFYADMWDMEDRRKFILTYINMFGKVSAGSIKKVLTYFTGSENVSVDFSAKDDNDNYILEIHCYKENPGVLFFEAVNLLLKKLIPAHLRYRLYLTNEFSTDLYVGSFVRQNIYQNVAPARSIPSGKIYIGAFMAVNKKCVIDCDIPEPETKDWEYLYNWLYPYWIREYPAASDTAKRQLPGSIERFVPRALTNYTGTLTLFKIARGSLNPSATATLGMAVGTVATGTLITKDDTNLVSWTSSGTGGEQITRIAGWTYTVGEIYDILNW